MPTTSNFGWTTPADTDLVKDGALAIRTLGNGIDTSMAELKGGTTGQVLSKTSNNDMDFTWVTTDDANAIQNAIVDAKGDLIAATAADTPARLAVGNNGETLVADSSASTGLRWQSAFNGNAIINSGMDIWQRGTSVALSSSAYLYTVDRWAGAQFTSAQSTVSQSTSAPSGIRYSAKVGRNNSATSTGGIVFYYALETADSLRFAGQTVTFSFYARAGSNYSSGSSALSVNLWTGTGTDQTVGNMAGSWTGSANPISQTATLTTSWQRFTYTGTIASTATQIGLAYSYTPSGTAGADDNFYITGVQLELGSVATTFKRAANTLAGELAACQRYYYRNTNPSYAYGYIAPWGSATSTTQVITNISVPAQMRTTPTSVDYANLAVTADDGTVIAITSATMGNGSLNVVPIKLAGTGFTQYRPYGPIGNNSTNAYIGFSAEL